jgi:hypothetical protein
VFLRPLFFALVERRIYQFLQGFAGVFEGGFGKNGVQNVVFVW